MKANVSTLLREFPKIRRAALSGEDVIVHTREGDLLIRAAPVENETVLGLLAGVCVSSDDDLDRPTSSDAEWNPTL